MHAMIFDLDGTLVDTAADLIAAANSCFRDLRLEVRLDPGTDASVAFRGGREMLRTGFARLGETWTEADVDAEYPRLLASYEAAIDVHSRLYPGATGAIETLRQSGWATAICTNKPEALADLLLTRLGVRDLFDSLVGADTLPVKKPNPAPLFEAIDRAGGHRDAAILVGDTSTDRDTARAAGIPSVLITFGPDGRNVTDLAPDALLDHFDDLPALAERLFDRAPRSVAATAS